MKFTHNFKNISRWIFLPSPAGTIDSFLSGRQQKRACAWERCCKCARHTPLVSISADPANSKTCTEIFIFYFSSGNSLLLNKVLILIRINNRFNINNKPVFLLVFLITSKTISFWIDFAHLLLL